MKRQTRAGCLVAGRRAGYAAVSLAAGCAGVGAAALTGLASAKSLPTIGIAKNVPVKGHVESVAVNSQGITVYTLSGESIPRHLECTTANTCLKFWFPVKAGSAQTKLSAANGVKGKLGRLHRNGFYQLTPGGHLVFHANGYYQVTLGGHPLYTFVGDGTKKRSAAGEGIVSFGGTWHVDAVKSAGSKTITTHTTTPTPTTPPYTTPYTY